MRLPRWLYIFWRRRIYLRSVGWWLTRRRVFREKGEWCQQCRRGTWLQIHHRNHHGQPKPKAWQFLPLARFVMFQQDYSDMVPLCGYHHALQHSKGMK